MSSVIIGMSLSILHSQSASRYYFSEKVTMTTVSQEIKQEWSRVFSQTGLQSCSEFHPGTSQLGGAITKMLPTDE